MLVINLADDFLQNIFHRHHAGDDAVFIDHDGEMFPAAAERLQLVEQRG